MQLKETILNLQNRIKKLEEWWCADVAHSDSAEYKMWGNGVALPCVLYVLEGVARRIKKGVTQCT